MAAGWVTGTFESDHLDDTAFELRSVRLHETISQLFSATLTVTAERDAVPALEEWIGAEARLVLATAEQSQRIHGMITQVRALDGDRSSMAAFELQLRPLPWMMQLVETLDIAIDHSIPEIIQQKLALVDLAEGQDFELRLGHYPKREFIVQYKETDLQFVQRLSEHHGISFFFEHSEEASCIVFSDNISGFGNVSAGPVAYRHTGEQRAVYRLERELNVIPRTFVCRDYNYRIPTIELQGEHVLEDGFGGGIIDYGAHVKTREEAAHMAQIRAEERLAQRDIFRGESSAIDFHAGQRVTIEDHAHGDEPLLLVEVEHHFSQPQAGAGHHDALGYRNRFRAVPAKNCYRPPRITPRPRIHGVLSGIVETRQGDVRSVAQLDDQGRYRIRFLFDTAASNERQASKQLRQIQPSSGPGYGMHFPLKPGVEVALAFVEGDPDRPLIVGAIPNPITPTPVASKNATSNRIHTRSGIVIEFEDGIVSS